MTAKKIQIKEETNTKQENTCKCNCKNNEECKEIEINVDLSPLILKTLQDVFAKEKNNNYETKLDKIITLLENNNKLMEKILQEDNVEYEDCEENDEEESINNEETIEELTKNDFDFVVDFLTKMGILPKIQ